MDIDWKQAITAVIIALVPAFLAYAMVSIAVFAENPPVWVFFVGIPVFGYLLYREGTIRGQLGGMFFWLAVETLLTPLVFVLYTFAFSSDQAMTGAGQAGAAIGGGILAIGAFVIGVPLAGVFYLISRKIQPSEDD